MATLADVFKDSRALLNVDPTAITNALWGDAILLRFIPKAHKELQLKLFLNNLPVIKEVSAVIDVAALATSLTLPSDIIEPISLEERADGSSDKFAEMREIKFENLPIDQTETLRVWCWREETIKFVGATTIREVRLNYRKGLTVPTVPTSPVGFILGELYLGPRVAALAGGSVGNTTLYMELTADADARIDDIVRANVKGQQGLPIKRIPYRRGARKGSWY